MIRPPVYLAAGLILMPIPHYIAGAYLIICALALAWSLRNER